MKTVLIFMLFYIPNAFSQNKSTEIVCEPKLFDEVNYFSDQLKSIPKEKIKKEPQTSGSRSAKYQVFPCPDIDVIPEKKY